MKTLVVYYSRTNTTKKVAEVLKIKLETELEEIIDLTDRVGVFGYVRGAKDAIFKKPTRVAASQYDPSKFDLVIIGTPVWAGTMTPAVRTYFKQNAKYIKNVAFFATQGSKNSQKVMLGMRAMIDKEPLAELELTTKEVIGAAYAQKLDEFIKIIKTNFR